MLPLLNAKLTSYLAEKFAAALCLVLRGGARSHGTAAARGLGGDVARQATNRTPRDARSLSSELSPEARQSFFVPLWS